MGKYQFLEYWQWVFAFSLDNETDLMASIVCETQINGH